MTVLRIGIKGCSSKYKRVKLKRFTFKLKSGCWKSIIIIKGFNFRNIVTSKKKLFRFTVVVP